MIEFFQALQFPLVRNSLLAGLLAGVACGTVGSFAVVRRITYIAGGIAHCVLGGVGAALYLRHVHGWAWLHPIYGALAAALPAAAVIGWVSLRYKAREDTVISALWAIGMAVGVLFAWKTPGYQQDLMSYLFGDIGMVSGAALWFVAALDAIIVTICLLCYKPMLAVCFDEQYARTRGINVEFYYMLLLAMTALTVVLLVTVVGVVMVIALLSLPAAIAGRFAKRLWQMIVLATLLSMAFTTAGLAISYSPGLPPGVVVILLAGGTYLLVTILTGLRAKLRPKLTHLFSSRPHGDIFASPNIKQTSPRATSPPAAQEPDTSEN